MWSLHLGRLLLSLYIIVSPFLFFMFHKHVLHETWNDDMVDRVTVRIFFMSQVAACVLAYVFEECGRMGLCLS